jgi:hypothetical protein
MKYYSRLKTYKASNLTFNPATGEGRSYAWYSISRKFEGVQVLNSYAYSPTTACHVSKLRRLFLSLNIEWVEIEAPRGLQDLDAAKALAKDSIQKLTVEINNKRSRPERNAKRFAEIGKLKEKLALIQNLERKAA